MLINARDLYGKLSLKGELKPEIKFVLFVQYPQSCEASVLVHDLAIVRQIPRTIEKCNTSLS